MRGYNMKDFKMMPWSRENEYIFSLLEVDGGANKHFSVI